MASSVNNSESGVGLRLSVYTPDRKIVESLEIDRVILPTVEGEVEILTGYQNFIGQLDNGVFQYDGKQGKSGIGFISSGFYYVAENKVTVMAETLEFSNEINRERALAAQKKAEAKLGSAESDFASFRKYELKLQRALIRQQLAGRH